MENLFTIEEQEEYFILGKQHFLNGNYKEAEPLFRLAIESAFQHRNYQTYTSSMIWLNRTLVNTQQINKMYPLLLILNPLIKEFATDEDTYYYRLHKATFNYHYLIGDPIAEFEHLFEDILPTENKFMVLMIGSNLLFTYLEHEEIDKGIALFYRLEALYIAHVTENKLASFMYLIFGFLLLYSKEDYTACQKLLYEIEHSGNIVIIESFAYNFSICKALLEIQFGEIETAKSYFEKGLTQVSNLIHVRYQLKLWVHELKKLGLKDDVIYYQDKLIHLLEAHYAAEMSAMRKETMDEMSRQFYEGQIYVDQLTNVKNRNFYENLLSKQQQVKNYTVAVLDIDHFKSFNDTFGHTVGDEAIKFIASHLSNWNTRHDISIVRYGGDEFIILMPYPFSEMEIPLRSLHERIMNSTFYIKKGNLEVEISISLGIGHTEDTYEMIDVLFERADTAIYKAKEMRATIEVAGVNEPII